MKTIAQKINEYYGYVDLEMWQRQYKGSKYASSNSFRNLTEIYIFGVWHGDFKSTLLNIRTQSKKDTHA